MIRVLSVVLCLSMPVAAFAEDPAPPADAPAQPALVPADSAPQAAPAVAEARYCSAHHCGGGKAKWVVLTGIAGTVITAVAIGTAVAVANANSHGVVR